MSSTLATLKINVETLDDCLYLLDSNLDCLSTFIIHVTNIIFKLSNIDNTKKLPNLKCFSLTSFLYTFHYDDRVIPLLHRMINLEELKLFLSVVRVDSCYIDGIQISKDILIYMPRLNKFSFSINSCIENENIKIDLPSNKDIQRSFIEIGYQQVGSYVDSTLIKGQGRCHVYSLPYQFEHFHLNNSFQGGTFNKVRYLLMTDERSFDYKLFKIISQDFPFLKGLHICNNQPPKNKQHSSTLIMFPHLKALGLRKAHADYAEQFLYEKNTHLPRLLTLSIKYGTLAIITNNFTNDVAFNCAKLKSLNIDESYVRPENFSQYFPLL